MIRGGRDPQSGPRRLFVYNLGFWRGARLSRILHLAGWDLRLGLPRRAGDGPAPSGDAVGVWGNSPTAWRGRAVADRRGVPLVRIEDAFLRSVLPGRAQGPLARRGPIGLLIDPVGVHFDPRAPSLIEDLVRGGAAQALTAEARAGIDRLRAADLSKYNAHLPGTAAPLPPGYVLIIDQTRGDASLMGAGTGTFRAMLAAARAEHPARPMLIRTHPETAAGLRAGHLDASDLRPGDALCDGAVSPWQLVSDAAAVFAVSSQLGYEALLAGHRPRLFGTPFYAGWGLTDDAAPAPDRRGPATVEALFAASHLLAPVWYDPCRDHLTDFQGAVAQIEAEAAAYRQDHAGHLAYGMRLWKRHHMARVFGQGGRVRFTPRPSDKVSLVWANRAADVEALRDEQTATTPMLRVEDGFLRSRGLGAALIPALSVVADSQGIYYDPRRPSDLEARIAAPLPPGGAARASALIERLRSKGISKYNIQGDTPEVKSKSDRHVILVPGQVEDDASIRFGAGEERTNLALLARVRTENPDAWIVWRPHPDVTAGLRPGAVPPDALMGLADVTASTGDPAALLAQVDAVWTITSTLGFEALIRAVPVTTLGAPFYAGWGLTRDLGPIPARRGRQVSLAHLVHAALIAYPRYWDPVSGLPCPVEVALDRLGDPRAPRGGPTLRLLGKLQGLLAGYPGLWR